jgi:hypothetical protein
MHQLLVFAHDVKLLGYSIDEVKKNSAGSESAALLPAFPIRPFSFL